MDGEIMPDMPQGSAQPPVAAAPGAQPPQDPAQGQGGGLADAIVQIEAALKQVTEAITKDPSAPDGAKQAFSSALDAFHAAANTLSGEGSPDEEAGESPDQESAETGPVPMQSGPGGTPMTHQNMRG